MGEDGSCSVSLIWWRLKENMLMNGSNLIPSCVVSPVNETERLVVPPLHRHFAEQNCVNGKFLDLQTHLWPQGWV